MKVASSEVADDIAAFSKGQYQKIRGGRRDTGYGNGVENAMPYGPHSGGARGAAYRDEDESPSSNGSDAIDMNVVSVIYWKVTQRKLPRCVSRNFEFPADSLYFIF